jgi:branched-chain amino acid aminotransferase
MFCKKTLVREVKEVSRAVKQNRINRYMAYFNENTVIWLDGQFLKATEAKGDLYSQTLHYGYGAFEGIRAYRTESGETRIFKSREHYERLRRSCELLYLPFAWDLDELTDITYKVLKANDLKDAYIRPLVYCPPNMTLVKAKKTHLMICVWDWGAYLGEKLLNITVSPYCRPHPRSTKVEAKACGHYVNSILATTEARDKGFDEALLLDCDGFLAEGSGANLFFEKDGVLYTPQLGNILPGITRDTVLEICAEHGIPVEQGRYKPELLLDADGAFFCGTGAEVVGIQTVDGYHMRNKWENTHGAAIRKAYLGRVREVGVMSYGL